MKYPQIYRAGQAMIAATECVADGAIDTRVVNPRRDVSSAAAATAAAAADAAAAVAVRGF